MLFSDFMKLYRNKFFDEIAISVDGEKYKHYLIDDIDINDIVGVYVHHMVTNIDYDFNTPCVLYVDLTSIYRGFVSLRHVRGLVENGTTIRIQDIGGRIIDNFDNKEGLYCFYDYADVLEYYFLNDVFYIRVNV